MTKDEALKLALEALELPSMKTQSMLEQRDVAIDAVKEALAQPEQEQWDAIPDAFNEWWNADYDDTENPYRKDSPAYWAWSGWKAARKQPEQEPVAWMDAEGDVYRKEPPEGWCPPHTPLYEQPPQRTWFWLTPEDEKEIKEHCTTVSCVLKAVKAKLKEKNT
jgi:hypothetical protein